MDRWPRAEHVSLTPAESCVSCGRDLAAGTPLFSDRTRLASGAWACRECAPAMLGNAPVDERSGPDLESITVGVGIGYNLPP
jgi:hypothetical protein